MSRTRICTGELVGCQPSWQSLEEIWNTALRGVDGQDREILLTHIIRGSEVVREKTLDKLQTEAGDPPVFDNMILQANQESPLRDIKITIGPGRVTSVSVEAEDHTWAIGRHTELMERLVKTRAKYALGSNRVPQWPRRRPLTLWGAAVALASAAFALVLSIAATLAVIFLADIVYGAPYIIVTSLVHHDHVPRDAIIVLPFSIAIMAVAIAAICMTVAASKSKVIANATPIWTANRSGAISVGAAAVSAFTGIIALFIK